MNSSILRRPDRRVLFAVAAGLCGLALVCAQALADEDRYGKSVSCSSDDGRRAECAADLRGYTVRDVDQSSRTECEVGRNWGYTDRGVWVDDGCRATFHFARERGRDAGRWGDDDDRDDRQARHSGDEQRVRCESQDGRRNECDADLRGYRIADVREISQADCDVGRNYGYDDGGVWVDDGCRAEFVFEAMGERRLSERDFDVDRR